MVTIFKPAFIKVECPRWFNEFYRMTRIVCAEIYDLPFISPGFCETGAKISASNTSYILKYADFVRKRKYFGPSQGPF